MKRVIVTGILIIVIIGVVTMAGYSNPNKATFNTYIPEDPLMDVTFEYPEGWKVFERRGAYGSFIQAQILEPLEPSDTTKEWPHSISITIYPKSKAQFSPLTAQGLAEDMKKKRSALKGYNVIASADTTIAGLKASDDTLAYTTIKIPLQANTKFLDVIERIICFQRGDNYYAISAIETTGDFETGMEIFERILKSILFR